MKLLYTNTLNNEGITAVRETYDNHTTKIVATKMIMTFLNLMLTLNNFVFNSINYIQIIGCAMGTICAAAYVNIFMAQFEKQHIMYIRTSKINQYYTYDISMIIIFMI